MDTSRYEMIVWWSKEDDAFVVDVPELPRVHAEHPDTSQWPLGLFDRCASPPISVAAQLEISRSSFSATIRAVEPTVALPIIRNTYPGARKPARSNRESVASFVPHSRDYGGPCIVTGLRCGVNAGIALFEDKWLTWSEFESDDRRTDHQRNRSPAEVRA